MKRIEALTGFVSGVIGMRKGVGLPTLFLMAAAALSLGAAAPAVSAAEFSEAELFFELNNTDGDLGIHTSVDGGPYTELEIEDTRGITILYILSIGRLARQGLTQLFIESAEPSFDELAPSKFFNRFPQGLYEISATNSKGEELEATVMLSHVLAAPAGNVTVAGIPAAEDCDAVNLPSVDGSEPVIIDWDPVTTSHPTIGKSGPVEIIRYQFFVEQGDVKLSVDLPPDVTEFQVPAEFIALGGRLKFEIIARTAALNNTAIENCFVVE